MANDIVPHSLVPPLLPSIEGGRQYPLQVPVQVHAGDRDVVVVVVGVPVFPRPVHEIEPWRGRSAYALPMVRSRRIDWRWLLLAPVLGLAGWALTAIGPARDEGFALRIPLPVSYPADVMVQVPAPSVALPSDVAPGPAVAAVPPATDLRNEAPGSSLLAIDRMPEVESAMRKALRSGVAEPWAARGLKGYAIAGPIEIEDNNACRILAVWAEADGSAGKPISSLRCLEKGGKWVSPPDGAAARFAAAASRSTSATPPASSAALNNLPVTDRESPLPGPGPAPARPDTPDGG